MLRKLMLYPFSLIYGILAWLRNKLYDAKLIGTAEFDLPVIAVGNLQAGGTGKTPHVEYIARLLKDEYKVAILSRGYKRKTSGFLLANSSHNAADIGDEPWMLSRKLTGVEVAVGEDREIAIPLLLGLRPDTDIIILDDAFQHRSVKPSLNILLTPYDKPFWEDSLLPSGMLRESPAGKKRADIFIVTKCSESLDEAAVIRNISPLPHQKIYYSEIVYETPYAMHGGERVALQKGDTILLFTGIAYPDPLINYLKERVEEVFWLPFPDHHSYTEADISRLATEFEAIGSRNKRVMTTEKDAVRLLVYQNALLENKLPVEVIPMRVEMTGSNAEEFDLLIQQYLQFYHSK
jgi:tetraacyldisaccharide 4'-kinase